MKFTVPLCPECGDHAISVLKEVQFDAGIAKNADNDDYRYTENDTVYWDTQLFVLTPSNCVNLQCAERHEWLSGWSR